MRSELSNPAGPRSPCSLQFARPLLNGVYATARFPGPVFLAGGAVFLWLYLERPRHAAEATSAAPVWEALTPEGAERARAWVRLLSRPTGPVFTNVAGADLAAYVFDELSKQLPPSAQQLEAAVIDDRLHVRALVKVSDFGGAGSLGPLAAMLGDREPVEFGGTLELVRPGLAQYRVKVLRLASCRFRRE